MTGPARTALITGATGFIGRHALKAFQNAGWQTHGTSHGSRGDNYRFLALDDSAGIEQTLTDLQPSAVIHLAGIAHRSAANEDYERINYQGTNILARTMAQRCPGATLVYASSATVYGDGPFSGPIREDHPTSPHGAYATSKLLGERAALACAPTIGVVAFRFPSLYARDWLLNIRKRVYAPKPVDRLILRLIGSHALYSFCAIENAVGAILLAASGGMDTGVYNVADQHPYAQSDVVQVVSAREGSRLRLPVPVRVVKPLYWGLSALLPKKSRTGVRNAYHKFADGMVLDCTRAKRAGYQPHSALTDLNKPLPRAHSTSDHAKE